MTKNLIQESSYSFSLLIINAYKSLIQEKREYVLSKQLLKSGTSIGANVMEAQSAESRKDFVHKLCISLKEARETKYWIKLLRDSDYITQLESKKLLSECESLIRILVSIINSTKRNI